MIFNSIIRESEMMLKTWQQRALQLAEDLAQSRGAIKIAIVGVGHELYADDAVGLEVARHLASSEISQRKDRLILFGGPAPESFCGVLRRFEPDLVILIDAASMDQSKGSICWLDQEELARMTTSSWAYPLSIMASYLTSEIGCEVCLLGIQPDRVIFGSISEMMRRRAAEIAEELLVVLCHCDEDCSGRSRWAFTQHGKRVHHGHENITQI
jgi:hydrogenase 3 maturation protease